MSNEAINRRRATKSTDNLNERAQRAVKVFRSMQFSLTSYARAITGQQNVKVEVGKAGAYTDGNIIYFQPPIRLGDDLQHDRLVCDQRNKDGLLICEACSVREEVLVNIYHEIAHIAFGSFAKVSEEDKKDALERAMKENGAGERARELSHVDSFFALAGYVSPYLPFLVNAIEDARVDSRMFEARKGIRKMLQADTYAIMLEGNTNLEGEHSEWRDAELNMQASLACYLAGAKYVDWQQHLHPKVGQDFKDEQLSALIDQINYSDNVSDSYYLSFPLVSRLRELGYFKTEEEQQEEEQEDETTGSEAGEHESGEEQDNPGESGDDDGGSESDDSSQASEGGNQSGEVSDDSNESSEGADDSDSNQGSQDSSETSGESEESSAEVDSGDSNGDEPDSSCDESDGESGGDRGDSDGQSKEEGAGNDSSGEGEGREGGAGSESGSTDGVPEDSGEESSEERSGKRSGASSDESEAENDNEGGCSGGSSSDVLSGEPGAGEQGQPDSRNSSQEASTEDREDRGTSGTWSDAKESEDNRTGDEPEIDDEGRDRDESAGDSGDRDSNEAEVEHSAGDSEAATESGNPDSGSDGSTEGCEVSRDSSQSEPDDRSNHGDHVEEEDAGEAELIETGPDEGHGIEVDSTPAPEYGTPDTFYSTSQVLHDKNLKSKKEDSKEEKAAITVAVLQGQYFETPSQRVLGVVEYDRNSEEDNCLNVWQKISEKEAIEFGVKCDTKVSEAILGPSLLKLRRVFSDNKNSKMERNRRSGKVNAKVLGKRAWSGDDRLFQKKRVPGKKDYAVIIALDVSSSTLGSNLALIKRAAMAQAELCHRLGVDFAVYAHNAFIEKDENDKRIHNFVMGVYHIKDFNEPWNDAAKAGLDNICGLNGNLDGHAVEYFRKRLDEVEATDKIIMYYTDGKMPAANAKEELVILQRELKTITRLGYVMLGVGIRTDSPTRHGLDTVQVDDDADLVKVVTHLGKRLSGAAR